MTVYFIQRVADASQIKIGSTNDLSVRLRNHASAFGDVRLIAKCAGGVQTERLYQRAFSHLRIEGEWFAATDELKRFVAENADEADLVVSQHQQTWSTKAPQSRRDVDARTAAKLLRIAIDRYPATCTVAAAHEAVFLELHSLNGDWSRRRVRSIYEGTPRRIDLFEILDLLTIARIQRIDWAEYLAPELKDEDGQ